MYFVIKLEGVCWNKSLGACQMTDSGMTMVAESIPVFRQYSEQLVNLTKVLLKEKIAGDFTRDHFGFMSFCFVSEQLNHFDAIRRLEIAGLSRSGGLIARAMTEGLVLLKWARRDSGRSLKWKAYALVHDWRLIEKMSHWACP